MNILKKLSIASLFALGTAVATGASATTILVFGQNGTADTITATDNGVTTTISGTDIAVTLTALENGVTPLAAFFDFTATSVGAAFACGTNTCQHFTGSFSFNAAADGSGTNFLSGTFTDSIFGSGNGLTLTASTPGNTVTFASDVITSLDLDRAISLSFTNVNPAVSVCGTTLCGFHSNVSGNFSGNIGHETPEPLSLALLGIGLFGMALSRRRS